MKIREMTITPEMASQWLKLNIHNRNVRQQQVNFLAGEITHGRWLLTHQGIALNGNMLIDGQHRLLAIIKANKAVACLVATEAESDTQEAIDIGSRRSVSDQLHLSDGLKNATLVCSAYRACSVIICQNDSVKISIGITRALMAEMGMQMDMVSGVVDKFKIARKAWIVGSLCVALWADEDSLRFIDSFYSGENLREGDAIKSARDWVINGTSLVTNGGHQLLRMNALLSSVKNSIVGIPQKRIGMAPNGADYFLSKKKRFVAQLREELKDQLTMSKEKQAELRAARVAKISSSNDPQTHPLLPPRRSPCLWLVGDADGGEALAERRADVADDADSNSYPAGCLGD